MSVHGIRRVRVNRARVSARRLHSAGATLVLLLLAACGDSSGLDGGGGATLSGTVRAAGSAEGLADAAVSIGDVQATSAADGTFELTGVPVGPATVRAARPGYQAAEAALTLAAGANSHDFTLDPQEIYELGANAVYVPAGVGPMRGTIVTLGGPVTRGFVTGERIAPATGAPPELEPSLQALGASLRALARSARVALMGSSTTGMQNSPASDATLFNALSTIAPASGQAGMADAPVLLFSLSNGSREAAGLVSRQPDRAIGLLVRVPAGVSALTTPEQLAVPSFVMQSELDRVVDNPEVRAVFSGNRSRGGLWALAVEPGIEHNVATSRGNSVAVSWISDALALRLPATPGDPLIALDQASGWLGNQTTLEFAPWADYPGDRPTASWLLSESAATSWRLLGTPTTDGGD